MAEIQLFADDDIFDLLGDGGDVGGGDGRDGDGGDGDEVGGVVGSGSGDVDDSDDDLDKTGSDMGLAVTFGIDDNGSDDDDRDDVKDDEKLTMASNGPAAREVSGGSDNITEKPELSVIVGYTKAGREIREVNGGWAVGRGRLRTESPPRPGVQMGGPGRKTFGRGYEMLCKARGVPYKIPGELPPPPVEGCPVKECVHHGKPLKYILRHYHEQHHRRVRKFVCQICGMDGKRPDGILRHLRQEKFGGHGLKSATKAHVTVLAQSVINKEYQDPGLAPIP